MPYIDSHLHFDDFHARGEASDLIDRARAADVQRMVAMGGRPEANALAVDLALEHTGIVYAAVGYDRDQAEAPPSLDLVRDEVQRGGDVVVAIGETGLDYHYSADSAPQQRKLFEAMLGLCLEYKRPVIVHSREAVADTLELLRPYCESADFPPGVLHCFTGDRAFSEQLLERGMYISFSGIVTFNSAAQIREAAAHVPADRYLIETDAPYLAPVPHRGKRNEPAFVPHVAECLAGVRGVDLSVISRESWENTHRLFAI